MDQDVIIEAVGKHLDTIETYVNAILQTSAPALYTAALSTSVERTVGNGLGIVVGGLIFVAANKRATAIP